ncbi:dTDP-4-dehydrorhamnose 3,5-epimerase [Aestuariibacter salexigens]|uniref:dTDP-4-dehydrorhamnose 3,5-epimerase n=1 Tax=Aestuariibacter salexigens TaxID=226010 RepID=UPI0003FC6B0B|nr:dTDP-4-dehydrorhamnose 3,5-epimerase [Aestuariibacter salexigens]
MQVIDTSIDDIKVIEPKVFGDHRGFFMETFRDDWFREQVSDVTFVQDNHSASKQGTLRGLHYQLKQPQGKLVRVVAGSVIDVAVDMRKSSPTFGKHVAVELSTENKRQMWVPGGFAHGFYVTSEYAEFVYRCTDYYAPGDEYCVLYSDPELGIDWQLLNDAPLVSDKDKQGNLFKDATYYE